MSKTTHILVVDDDLISGMILEQTIQNSLNSIEISKAENGLEALKIIESKPIDVMLLDINMPVMNGFELLENLRKKAITTPTFMITSSNLEEDKKKSLRYKNVIDFFQKPFTLLHVDSLKDWMNQVNEN